MEDTADIVEAVASLLWPLVVLVVVIGLLPELRKRIRTGDLNVKVGQFELSVQEASDALRTQVTDLQEAVERLTADGARPRGAPRSAARAPSVRGARPAPGVAPGLVLWVSPAPERHAFELARLEDGGAQVQVARSVDEAVRALAARPPVVVVAEPDADVVARLREHTSSPVIVYGASAPIDVAGATAVTRAPLELFRELRALAPSR